MQLTKNFTREEMACPCGCGQDVVDWYALECLQRFRDALKIPFRPNVNRCPKHNQELIDKGYPASKKSLHMKHVAFDVPLPDYVEKESAVTLAEDAGFTGIGLYDWGLHLDTGRTRRWDYRTK